MSKHARLGNNMCQNGIASACMMSRFNGRRGEMLLLSRLDLTDFRSWARLRFAPQSPLAVVIGANGAGKTNILEAVSLLVPGRGLRSARLHAMAKRDGSGGFAVAARFSDDQTHGEFTLGTAVAPESASKSSYKRQFLVNGAAPQNQGEIASMLSAVWVTPQMDQVFEVSASGRRRFLDCLVVALEPGHGREASAYENAMARRNKLLTGKGADALWLSSLEESMARHSVALAAARRAFCEHANATAAADGFPPVRIELADAVADRLAQAPALAVENWLRAELTARRPRDAAAGGATLGVHRADMMLVDATSGEPASTASTGQRRAMLLGVILAHAALIEKARGTPPLLLLDEPLVHLDESRREALFAALAGANAQVLLTGTDADAFAPLRGKASFWEAAPGTLTPSN